MRLRIYSDIHLEFGPFSPPSVAADVIVIAGDLANGTRGIDWILDHFPDTPVVLVLGNHDLYYDSLPELTRAIRDRCAGTRIHLLENEAVSRFDCRRSAVLGCRHKHDLNRNTALSFFPMSTASSLNRRDALKASAALVATTAVGIASRLSAADNTAPNTKGHVNHSVCKWCYPKVTLEELCQSAKSIGLSSIELLQPSDFPMLKRFGLTCAMVSGPSVNGLGGITKAFNRVEHHDLLVEAYLGYIDQVSNAGMNNLICFSGNRAGLSDEKGLENCALGIKRLMSRAEDKKVTICMELLNSRVDHGDYQCDHSAWGVELCKRVGSDRFKLLYDIYHMQIMEGDVIASIRKNHQYFAHYHTGGVPGRHEIDDTQELHYPAIMKAIVQTGFKGHVAQEFIPQRPNALDSLKQGVQICDV